MFKILRKQVLNQQVKRIDIAIDETDFNFKPGQFIILMPTEKSQRIAINAIDFDMQRKSISVYVHKDDSFADELDDLKIGDYIFSIAGPFGKPFDIKKEGLVVCVSENVQVAANVALSRALQDAGNKVIAIADFGTRQSKLLEPQLQLATRQMFITSESDMYDTTNSVRVRLDDVLSKNNAQWVYVDGSIEFIESINAVTSQLGIKTYANIMNYISQWGNIFDTTSFTDGVQKIFPCVDGSIIDASSWNFSYLSAKLKSFKEYCSCQNKQSLLKSRKKESGIFPKLFLGLVKSKL